MKKLIVLILVVSCVPLLHAMAADSGPMVVEKGIDSWENPVKRYIFWKSISGADRLFYTCFEATDEMVAGCVCRGPKMYNTPTDAHDEFFKFNYFNIFEQDGIEELENKAKEACKPAGVIIG
ncbi:MAG: hypothetical protein IPJ71_17860 [Bdellovibrionales bacterium]|nr:hypothetical protein [Bdellovibrionales bacterium]